FQRRGTDTDDVLARFRTEREILSGLNHPNIARLLDGGATEDGLPYLVMEYVEGRPITEYCDERGLSVPDRLDLFVDVARAVQAAHARLVVHRDIKPSNVLVTPGGRVKLLDFGIAKLLDPAAWPGETPRTRTGRRPLTPEYASPEQVLGRSITVASDIYQLGLLLCRLLTDRLPFDAEKRGRELEDAITGTRPSRPSELVRAVGDPAPGTADRARLARRLRGDLDTIVLTALRKEPERRYPSAHEMAEDVRRHLRGRPISARQESRVYRARKLLRRNPWLAPAAVVLVALLGIYIGTLIRHGRALESERNVARLEAEKARAAQAFLTDLFRSADPFSPSADSRRDIRVGEVMEEGVLRARSTLDDRPVLQAMMFGTIGDVFLGLGDAERAVELRREAYEAARASFGPGSPEAAVAYRKLVRPTVQLVRRESFDDDEAVLLSVEALNGLRRALGESHVETRRAELDAAEAMLFGGSLEVGEILARHALAELPETTDAEPADRARALLILTRLLTSTGQWDEATPLGREAVTAFAEAYGSDHPHSWAMRLWLSRLVPAAEGDSLRRDAIDAFETQLGPTHDLTIRSHLTEALARNRRGDYDAAADAYRTVLERRLARGDDPSSPWSLSLRRSLGDAARAAGRLGEAERAYRTALEAEMARRPRDPGVEAAVRARLAWTLVEQGRPRDGLRQAREARAGLPETEIEPLVECVLARAFRATGRISDADSVTALAADRLAETGYTVRDYHPCWGLVSGS
ncbi:MAG: protein kinase domain-containing protein, partial [Gemmatimonadota bacterium]